MKLPFLFCLCFLFCGFPCCRSKSYGPKTHEEKFNNLNRGAVNGMNFLVGSCTLEQYFTLVHSCEKVFYDNYIGNTAFDCTSEYKKMYHCVRRGINECLLKSWLLNMLIHSRQLLAVYANLLTMIGDKTKWCVNGGLEAPQYVQEGVNCNQPRFTEFSQACVNDYQQSFQTKSSAQLCVQYWTAKMCLRQRQQEHCSSPSNDVTQMMDAIYVEQIKFMPFCRPHQIGDVIAQIPRENDECPPWFRTDVVVLMDMRYGTEELEEGKKIAECLMEKFYYDNDGIRIALVQFNSVSVLVSARFEEFEKATQMKAALEDIKPIPNISSSRSSSASEADALAFAENMMSRQTKDENIFYPPVIVVVSKRKIEIQSVKKTIIISSSDYGFDDVASGNVQSTADRCNELVNRICFECRHFEKNLTRSAHEILEHSPKEVLNGKNPSLNYLYKMTSRFGDTYLPLLFNPVRITRKSSWDSTSFFINSKKFKSSSVGEN